MLAYWSRRRCSRQCWRASAGAAAGTPALAGAAAGAAGVGHAVDLPTRGALQGQRRCSDEPTTRKPLGTSAVAAGVRTRGLGFVDDEDWKRRNEVWAAISQLYACDVGPGWAKFD